MSALSRLRHPNRETVGVLVVLVLFAVALVLWAGRAPAGSPVAAPHPVATPGATATSGAGTPSGRASTSPPDPARTLPNGGRLVLPTLPISGGNDIRNATHLHAVTLEARSDKAILQLAWAVRKGSPPTGYRTFVRSPLTIRSPATGDGVLVQLAAQASDNGSYVTCTVRIDGVVKSTRTVRGAYSVAFCVA